MIEVKELSKTFSVEKKDPGMVASLKSLFKKQMVTKYALNKVSLNIGQGEIIGLVGANGAGKTTLVKVLSGIIHKTSGDVSVLGFDPWKRDNRYRRQLALIMGQKAQVWWDLPPMDSFLLLQEIYQIPEATYQANLKKLSEALNIEEQLMVPVRKLSLGERMKVELIAALLHEPRVIFLDEPTIGLDIMSQKAVRNFLSQYQRETNATIILTSHYMQDIEELCPRLALIKEGEIIYDGPLGEIVRNYADTKRVELDFQECDRGKCEFISKEIAGTTHEVQGSKIIYRVKKNQLTNFLQKASQNLNLEHMNISDVQIETVIENYLAHEKH